MAQRPGKSLYVRNIHPNTRNDDIRKLFDKFGPISDVYVPLDYYTRMPRGFAYVQFDDPRDADEALYATQRSCRCLGRDLEVEFAKGDRKEPNQMRAKEGGGRYSRGRRGRSYSRSPSPRRRSRSPRRGRSPSPRYRRRSRSPSPRYRSRSRSPYARPQYNDRSPPRRSPSPRQQDYPVPRRYSRSPAH